MMRLVDEPGNNRVKLENLTAFRFKNPTRRISANGYKDNQWYLYRRFYRVITQKLHGDSNWHYLNQHLAAMITTSG